MANLNRQVARNESKKESRFYSNHDMSVYYQEDFLNKHPEARNMDLDTLKRYKYFRMLKWQWEKRTEHGQGAGIKEGLEIWGVATDEVYPFEWDFSINEVVRLGLAKLS